MSLYSIVNYVIPQMFLTLSFTAMQTHTHAESPTTVGPVHNTNNLVGIVSTATIGFFVIVAILVIVAIGFSIQHWRRKR